MVKLVVGTWSFSSEAVKIAAEALQTDLCACSDALEKGINALEQDEKYGPCFVGRGGARNSAGYLEMDAAIMDGVSLKFGAVTALQGIDRAFSVAKCVMQASPHSILTADGAKNFAEEQGFKIDQTLLKPRFPNNPATPTVTGHDTVGLIALNTSGNICAGVSTSGMANKHPGRVGDSPLPGGGLYADNSAGAACCSGDGDQILKFCPSFKVVELIRQGFSAQDACAKTIKDIFQRLDGDRFEIAIIAADTKGGYGAASTVETYTDPLSGKQYSGFPYVAWDDSATSLVTHVAPTIKPSDIKG